MSKKLILVDTSYTLFYRYFATLRWMSLAHPEVYKENIDNKDYNWKENKIFIEKIEKVFLEGIIKLLGKRIYKDSIIIFCMDTPKEQVWRTELKCDYKGDRFDMTTKTNFKPTFDYVYNTVIPKILENNKNMYTLRMNKLEADDIIAVISKYLENVDTNIYLLSGDEDFLQLGRPNLFFVNYKTKKPKELSTEEAKYALHKKILLGDKSDCIKSIFPPRFSTKVKKELLESIDKFNDFIKTNNDIKVKYEENLKLINFDYIPTKLRTKIINEYTKLNIKLI